MSDFVECNVPDCHRQALQTGLCSTCIDKIAKRRPGWRELLKYKVYKYPTDDKPWCECVNPLRDPVFRLQCDRCHKPFKQELDRDPATGQLLGRRDEDV